MFFFSFFFLFKGRGSLARKWGCGIYSWVTVTRRLLGVVGTGTLGSTGFEYSYSST